MNLDEAHAILAANQAAAEGSFLFWLHERDRFDRRAFWTLYNAAIIIGASEDLSGLELRERSFHVYDAVMRIVLWHHSPHDHCRVSSMPGRNLNAYLERLEWALKPLILGRPSYGWNAPLSLKNPEHAILQQYFG